MTRFAVDTSVIVAASVAAHARHRDATSELESRLDAEDVMLIPAHSLAEAYSVLTGQPPPGRLSPAAARDVLQRFVDAAESLVGLGGDDYLELLRRAADRGVAGGRTYDSLIAEAARIGEAEVFLTFNTRHFVGITSGIEVREPESR